MVDPFEADAKTVLQPKTVLKSIIKTLPDYANPSVLHQKYVVEGLSLKQIAGSCASSKTAVLEGLRRFKIPVRSAHETHGRPSHPRFGYHFIGGKLAPLPREQRVIKRVRQMYLKDGVSLNAIAKALTKDGVPTKQGRTRWHHEMVRSILKKEGLA